jgi:hypothetical protein
MRPWKTARVCQTGPSSQRSATPVSSGEGRAPLRLILETGVRKIRGSVTNENSVNVVLQIKTLIPAMISNVGTSAFGPPAKIRTGHEVRTIATLRRADLRTILRKLGAEDSSSLPGTITGFSIAGFMVTPCAPET